MINVLALVVAAISLALSVTLALRQLFMMRHANQLPMFVELNQEFRSQEFTESESFVLHELATDVSADNGVLLLPPEALKHVNRLTTFYNILGALIIFKVAKESIIVAILGYRASIAWDALEPFILKEREIRGNPYFVCYFEDLVSRARANYPAVSTYNIQLRRLDRSASGK
ncbi:MAG: hypothetical protein QOC94_3249 [Actinoplanes sp.]|nr:hypothetical protein [Actinoplanes sp.]